MQPKHPGLDIEKLQAFLSKKGFKKQMKYCTPNSEVWSKSDFIEMVRFNTNINPIPFEVVLDIFNNQLHLDLREIGQYRRWIENNFRPDGTY